MEPRTEIRSEPSAPAKRYKALRGLIRPIYRIRPDLKEKAPLAVRLLAEADWLAATLFVDLTEGDLDPRTRQRAKEAYLRAMQQCVALATALGLLPQAPSLGGGEEEEEDDEAMREYHEGYRRHYAQREGEE